MKARLFGRAGLGLAAGVALALAGCTADSDPGPDSGDTGTEPALALVASSETLASTSFRFELDLGELMTATGATDPVAQATTTNINFSAAEAAGVEMEIRSIGEDVWLSMGPAGRMLGLETEWVHLDLSRLGTGTMGFRPDQGDPANITGLFQSLDEVEQVDERTYSIKVDLTKVEGSAFAAPELQDLLGEESEQWEFIAVLDEEGRLADLSTQLPSVEGMPAQEMTVKYFDYGAEVDITAPPADQVSPAPDLVYGMVGA